MILDSNQSRRKAVSNSDGRPVFHKQANKPIDSEAPALSHSTVHRWLGFIGAMTITLQIGAEALLQAEPNSSIHRFLGHVDPKRARTLERLKVLSIARRLLHLQTLWDRHFLTCPFFARFATVARPP